MKTYVFLVYILLFSATMLIAQDGNTVLGAFTNNPDPGDLNSFFGDTAGGANGGSANNNSFFGSSAGANNAGNNNSFFGKHAGFTNIGGHHNSFFGTDAGQDNTANYNSFFGADSGLKNSTGAENSFFGAEAGLNNTTGESNSFFGADAGDLNSEGSSNSFFGDNSGVLNDTGDSNSFFGARAGEKSSTGNQNVLIGALSGISLISGWNNTFIGIQAGQLTTGSNNSYFGGYSGSKITGGSRNICLGYASGPTTQVHISNRLYIDIKESDSPLIYGEFENDFVKINGTLEASAIGNDSDINIKNSIEKIDIQDILQRVIEMPITTWQYNQFDGVQHIGPMAQDFYKAFKLGRSDKIITTIDADGIALASIQALSAQNETLSSEMKLQKEEISELRTIIISLQKEMQLLKDKQ